MRLAKSGVPEVVRFDIKPTIAVAMDSPAIDGGDPFAWVAADTVNGVGNLEMALRRAGKAYVRGVASTAQCHSCGTWPEVSATAEEIAVAVPAKDWVRRSAGDGTKGPRLFDWAYLELAH